MSKLRTTVLAMLLTGTSLGVVAQTAAEHTQHHPEGAAAVATPPATQPAMPPNAMGPGQMPNMAGMEQRMQAMRTMRDKMAAASTPEERQELMAKRMEMMESMMQMMMDCHPPAK